MDSNPNPLHFRSGEDAKDLPEEVLRAQIQKMDKDTVKGS